MKLDPEENPCSLSRAVGLPFVRHASRGSSSEEALLEPPFSAVSSLFQRDERVLPSPGERRFMALDKLYQTNGTAASRE